MRIAHKMQGRILEGSRVQWYPLSSTQGAINPLGQRVPGTLWAPGEKKLLDN